MGQHDPPPLPTIQPIQRILLELCDGLGVERWSARVTLLGRLVGVADGVVIVIPGDNRNEPLLKASDHSVAIGTFLYDIAQTDDAVYAQRDQEG